MKAIKKLLDTTTKRVVALVVVLVLLTWIVLFFVARDTAIALVKPLLWTLLLVAVLWLAIHFGLKAWRKRKRSEFDEAVAAKEGIEDRRREWAGWTEELEKRGIDRYELPFYLLVGEPQSGKSVLLHNSDLHFPFGQNRLSGVGGTRGCDWWFTEEAVILDLAGRLFTHEGGAADRLEFEAFLALLAEFRPLCPANGVILVIPCDSLLQDSEEQCVAKANKIQSALLTLTTKLQAQLPVYLVLTKGDQIFGFAESVHRLDVERRHQMFGWSRPADKIDAPFDLKEVVQGFEGMVQRARLLRAHMSAGARLPEALPEVDRMYAFPHELEGMQTNLETYLKRIFTASNVTERVFFRGVYLTSGLQSGVPIAKVCKELFGQAGEADARDLQALFSKPRAYFIKDLIRTRVFGERGLVRPTQGRVQQTRRVALLGYGFSGLVVLASFLFAIVYLAQGGGDERTRRYDAALDGVKLASADQRASIQDLLFRLQQVNDAITLDPHAYEKAFYDPREDFRGLYCALFDARVVPKVKELALAEVDARLAPGGLADHPQLVRVCKALTALLDDVDFSASSVRADVLGCLPDFGSGRTTDAGGDSLSLSEAFELRDDYGSDEGLLLPRDDRDQERLLGLAQRCTQQLDGCLEPGSRTQPGQELGYMLAWMGAETARGALVDTTRVAQDGMAIQLANRFAGSMAAMARIEENELTSGGGGKQVKMSAVLLQSKQLLGTRDRLNRYVSGLRPNATIQEAWPPMDRVLPFTAKKFEGHEGAYTLSSFGLHFGSDDAGRTVFAASESAIGGLSGEITVPGDYSPQKELDDPAGLLGLCQNALPLEPLDGRMAGLADRLRHVCGTLLDSEDVGSATFEAFLAECTQFAEILRSQVQGERQARQAVLGKDAPGEDGKLCVPLVRELTATHQELGRFVQKKQIANRRAEGIKRWQEHIESLLATHMGGLRATDDRDWAPHVTPDGDLSPEAWSMLEALSSAAALNQVAPGRYPVRSLAEDAERGAFFSLARQLEHRWDGRDPEALEQTKDSVAELDRLAESVRTRLPNADALKLQGLLEAWGNRVDSVLFTRLDLIVRDVERLWQPSMERGSFRDAVDEGFRGLNSIQEKMDASQRAGLDSLTSMVEMLKPDGRVTNWLALPQTRSAVARLGECRVPRTAFEVTNNPEYKRLVATMQQMLGRASGEGFGPYLAETYRDVAPDPAAPAPENAGIRLVRETKRQLARAMLAEIQRLYLERLDALMAGSRYQTLMDVLFWQKSDDPIERSDAEVVDALSNLFDPKKGDLVKLMKEFRLAGVEPPLEDLVFPRAKDVEEDEWAACQRFLAGLQEFLFPDGKGNLRDAAFSFRIRPQVGTSGSLWSLDTIGAEDKRDFFYYPGDNSTEDLKKEVIGPGMDTRLAVLNWGFGVSRPDRAMTMLWSKLPVQSEARNDANRFHYTVRSSLAPLLLAWCGTPVDEDEPTEFVVDLTPERSKRPAPILLEFDAPLPLRPVRP